jgi:hypothetical protein
MKKTDIALNNEKIRMIAFDLDGTLLDSNKELSRTNLDALERAADAGIELVPTTGRFFNAMPDAIRKLPFLHYAITINGAAVTDLRTGKTIYQAEMPWQLAVDVMKELDTFPVVYDCFMGNCAYMTAALKEKIDVTVASPHYRKMLHELRVSVPDLKEYLMEQKKDVQKIQFFSPDDALRQRLLKELPLRYANIYTSTSVPDNIEINQIHANKGEALLVLADYLGVPQSATMAFGDGLNDLSMIKEAGIGIAMANACDAVKEVADWIAPSCDESGVACGINKFGF